MSSEAKPMGRTRHTLRWLADTFWRFPMHILAQPFKGFDEMKNEKRGSYAFAFFVLVFSCLLGPIEYVYSGFLVNYSNPYQINSLYLMLVTLFPVLLFVTGNWSVTTLLDGKGRYGEIFLTLMYALFPMCLLRLLAMILTNVLTLDEMAFVIALQTIGAVMLCLYLFIGLVVIHEYSFGKGLGSMLLTLAAIMVIVFVLMLALTLVADVVDFATIFIKELRLKYL